jgi:hypothetical protein
MVRSISPQKGLAMGLKYWAHELGVTKEELRKAGQGRKLSRDGSPAIWVQATWVGKSPDALTSN